MRIWRSCDKQMRAVKARHDTSALPGVPELEQLGAQLFDNHFAPGNQVDRQAFGQVLARLKKDNHPRLVLSKRDAHTVPIVRL